MKWGQMDGYGGAESGGGWRPGAVDWGARWGNVPHRTVAGGVGYEQQHTLKAFHSVLRSSR